MRSSPLRVELATCLLNDFVEEAAGVLFLDLLLDPPVGGEVSNIRFVSRTCAASEYPDDTTSPVEDDGPRVTRIGKLAARFVVGQDSDLYGGLLDAVLIVGVGEGFEAIGATHSGHRHQPIFYHEQTLLPVDVELLWVAHLSVLDVVVCLEETILGVVVVRSIARLRE